MRLPDESIQAFEITVRVFHGSFVTLLTQAIGMINIRTSIYSFISAEAHLNDDTLNRKNYFSNTLSPLKKHESYYIQGLIHCVQKKHPLTFFSYLHELCVDLNKNCSDYT